MTKVNTKTGRFFKKFLIFAVFALVLVGVFKLGKLSNNTKEAEIKEDTKSQTNTSGEVRIPKALDQVIDDESGDFKINFQYPVLENIGTETVTNQINTSVLKEAHLIIDNFKKDAEPNPSLPGDMSLDADYKFAGVNHGLVSIEFQVSEFLPGAAHPNNYSTTLLYKASDGSKINSIGNICANQNACLSRIVPIAQKYLKTELKRLGAEYDESAQTGSAVNIENYRDFVFKNEGLQIIYDSCQVAPCVYGTVYITIPWGELTSILKSEYLK